MSESTDALTHKLHELRQRAQSGVSATPSWVWVVVGGIALLLVGLLVAGAIYSTTHRSPQE